MLAVRRKNPDLQIARLDRIERDRLVDRFALQRGGRHFGEALGRAGDGGPHFDILGGVVVVSRDRIDGDAGEQDVLVLEEREDDLVRICGRAIRRTHLKLIEIEFDANVSPDLRQFV